MWVPLFIILLIQTLFFGHFTFVSTDVISFLPSRSREGLGVYVYACVVNFYIAQAEHFLVYMRPALATHASHLWQQKREREAGNFNYKSSLLIQAFIYENNIFERRAAHNLRCVIILLWQG